MSKNKLAKEGIFPEPLQTFFLQYLDMQEKRLVLVTEEAIAEIDAFSQETGVCEQDISTAAAYLEDGEEGDDC